MNIVRQLRIQRRHEVEDAVHHVEARLTPVTQGLNQAGLARCATSERAFSHGMSSEESLDPFDECGV
jgi:hypothetical protein